MENCTKNEKQRYFTIYARFKVTLMEIFKQFKK